MSHYAFKLSDEVFISDIEAETEHQASKILEAKIEAARELGFEIPVGDYWSLYAIY